ncbi:hypothetical protein SpCBS45565_g02713 [Spizellomyces sp. 'palustris']|nr:hypothetical protein SpCBS45565_g02713 [Spizellomyces sp. 'palustris']
MSNKVDRDSFRIFRTRDGRYLAESPHILKNAKAGEEITDMLVVMQDGVSVQDKKRALPVASDGITSSLEVCGVIGVIELVYAQYLVVATARTLAATLQSHKIWRITAASLLPIGTGNDNQLIRQKKVDETTLAKYTLDQELLQSISQIANSGHLYYSTTYDITHSVQHNYLKSSGKAQKTVIDDRYFFTKHLAGPLLKAGQAAAPWVMNVICGFAGTIDMNVKLPLELEHNEEVVRPYKLTLISRLNRRRVGTRYVRRGLDFDGNTANNVEMEQIVYHEDFHTFKGLSTYIQVRGSVPSIWGQELDLRYRPELLIADINKPKVWTSIKKHYDDLRHQYIGEKAVKEGGADIGKVVCVNLLDVTGFEGRLTKVYEETIRRFADEKVSYEEFPINKWCKNRNFRNMEILMDRVRDRLVNSGWFIAEGEVGDLHVTKLQTGLARVSCLDSLDRTNLTCSIFARYMLPYQVQSITAELPAVESGINGVIASDMRDPVALMRKSLEPFTSPFTNLWADSGDAVSLLYAGTGALKADVTRTGKKTLTGSLTDGINSLTRYYLNNFVDGRRQDAYDLWTGKAVPEQINKLVETEGVKRAQRVSKPYIAKGQGVLGRIIPGFVIDQVEPLLQTATEYARATVKGSDTDAHARWRSAHIDGQGNPRSFFGLILSTVKLYAPGQISGVLEFLVALVVFFYLIVLARVFHIQGQLVVNRPKLSVEYRNIYDLLD